MSYPNTNRQNSVDNPNEIKRRLNITNKLDKLTYVDQAETIIKHFKNRKAITHTQIRNILSMTNELLGMISNSTDPLGDDIVSHSQYIKMKIAYAAGRDKDTGGFVEISNIMTYLENIKTSKSREELLLICRYMEALCAYHKYYIKDNK
ncbi:MAG: type III-A CRISPR-associated protein Csm2 [Oscillospiraceae bacterium]|nr:type III-A CRISPR-associated protein Csm2 [Oscillospiraceae bacterium]